MKQNFFTYLIYTLFLVSSICGNTRIALSNNADNERLNTNRSFDKLKIEELRNDTDFAYINKVKTINIWDEIKEWISDKVSMIFELIFGDINLGENSFEFLNVLKWVFLAGCIIFIIANLMGVKVSHLFSKRHELKDDLFNEILEENINELNFEELINKHLADNNYRYVIRLYFLRSLKELSNRELINWQPYKTNREYINELENERIKQEFSKIARLFSYVWYGKFELNEERFQQLSKEFNNFNMLLNPIPIA